MIEVFFWIEFFICYALLILTTSMLAESGKSLLKIDAAYHPHAFRQFALRLGYDVSHDDTDAVNEVAEHMFIVSRCCLVLVLAICFLIFHVLYLSEQIITKYFLMDHMMNVMVFLAVILGLMLILVGGTGIVFASVLIDLGMKVPTI